MKGTIFFTEEINKIVLTSNDDKRMQSIDLIEIYAYGTGRDLIRGKEESKCNNIIKNTKKINYDDVTKKKKKNIIQISHKFLIIQTKY